MVKPSCVMLSLAPDQVAEAERIISLASNPEIWTPQEVLCLLVEFLDRECDRQAERAKNISGWPEVKSRETIPNSEG